MINPCTTLPTTGYYIDVVVRSCDVNSTFIRKYTSNFIDDTMGDMGRFNVSYTELFNDTLKPNFTYVFTVIPTNNPSKLLILY